ncbi:MAG TPA: C-terminal binding protein [Planctomycetaceae bacterium]|nr:C-terminal binding protein [Planctomycetaceae bacterium]
MKVAVTDYTFPSLEIETAILEPLGCRIVAGQCKTPAQLIELTRDADYVITQFAPVNREVIGAMEKSQIIVRYGIGVDNVDLAAARERGIPVCNVPDFCIDEVADHTLAFILGTTRQVVTHCRHLRAGKWGLAVPLSDLRTLRDQTVGVVGFGRIGRAVVERLRAFKSRVLVSDPVVSAETVRQAGCEPVELSRLLAESDIVTLHCPSTPESRRMINTESLRRMKPGAILINLGRGDLVDTAALVAALQEGRLAAAALDVCDPEPIPQDSPLLTLENVIVAPHIASASEKSVRQLRETAANLVARRVRGEPLPSVVNGVTK